jgi:hypothetical protein
MTKIRNPRDGRATSAAPPVATGAGGGVVLEGGVLGVLGAKLLELNVVGPATLDGGGV